MARGSLFRWIRRRPLRRWVSAWLLLLLAAPPGRAQAPEAGPPAGAGLGLDNAIRGTVTAADAKSFSIRTDEGESFTVLYGVNTRVMKDRQPIKPAQVHVGDMLIAAGLLDKNAKTVGAAFVIDLDPEQVRKAREGFGKTWVAGRITAIDDLKITLERFFDKQKQIIAVDENTSFRRHRESITFPDVKVGDSISAQGAMHENTFVATVLSVMPPRRGASDGAGPHGEVPHDKVQHGEDQHGDAGEAGPASPPIGPPRQP